jgi:glutathione peroxidase
VAARQQRAVSSSAISSASSATTGHGALEGDSGGSGSDGGDLAFSKYLQFSGVRNAGTLTKAASASQGSDDIPREVDVSDKVVLLVNTASYCGFTPQLGKMQALHDKYAARGLVVLAVPSNDFGAQEPGSDEEVLAFYRKNYGVTFPVGAKTRVIGPDAHPLYQRIARTLGDAGTPAWNFAKVAFARGQLVGVFPPDMDPTSGDVTDVLERELPPNANAD